MLVWHFCALTLKIKQTYDQIFGSVSDMTEPVFQSENLSEWRFPPHQLCSSLLTLDPRSHICPSFSCVFQPCTVSTGIWHQIGSVGLGSSCQCHVIPPIWGKKCVRDRRTSYWQIFYSNLERLAERCIHYLPLVSIFLSLEILKAEVYR